MIRTPQGFINSFFLDKKRNKKIKTAYNFGNNYVSLHYILGSIVTRQDCFEILCIADTLKKLYQ